MDINSPTLNDLFAQLGLPDDNANIAAFIAAHKPLPHELTLIQAPWWTPSQAEFLKEAIADDAQWAIIVDEFDDLLRQQ